MALRRWGPIAWAASIAPKGESWTATIQGIPLGAPKLSPHSVRDGSGRSRVLPHKAKDRFWCSRPIPPGRRATRGSVDRSLCTREGHSGVLSTYPSWAFWIEWGPPGGLPHTGEGPFDVLPRYPTMRIGTPVGAHDPKSLSRCANDVVGLRLLHFQKTRRRC